MRPILKLALLATPLLLTQCGINKQVQQAKVLSKCKYAIGSADSATIARYDIQEFKEIKQLDEINPLKYPRIATGLVARDVPFRANINLEIVNPTNDLAAINKFEYRLLLSGNELATGVVERRIEVPPGGGKVTVPIPVNANAYNLVANSSTRNAFIDMVRSLAGSSQASKSQITLKIKPTLMLGDKQITYPGYIDIDKDVSRELLLNSQKN